MDPIQQNPQAEPATAAPQASAAGFCRACGKGLSQEAIHSYQGTIYCADHLPRVAAPAPATPGQNPNVSPGLAFLLGLIPGVGAIYNGQYGKGFVHVLIAGLLFTLAGAETGPMEPLFGLFIPVWFFYMAFEAYHTAKKRALGEVVDEFSSIFPNQGGVGFPVLPVLLIGLGIIFLLNNLDIISIRRLMPYAGPVFLIALGCYMLYARAKANAALGTPQEAGHERN
jgi:TM2 domain-containing membrane protein YozV